MMTNRKILTISVFAAALLALCLPTIAGAQDRYPDNRRDRDRYDQRQLKDSINRLDRLSKQFQGDLDRALDHSRRDGTQREDRINQEAREFRRAVSNLKSRFGDGRDLNRSRSEADRVLQEAQQLERIARPRWYDSRLSSEWSQIRQELNSIENAYGYGRYNNGRGVRG